MNYIEELLSAGFTEDDIIKIRQCIHGEKDLYLDYPDLFSRLCDYFGAEMPPGTRRFKDGDADVWLIDRMMKRGL